MTGTQHLAAARRLEPMVMRLRDRFDTERKLPGSLVEALHAAGLFRMWLPRAIGGAELAPLEFLETVEELARQDGSVGWCTTIAAGSARLAGALEEDAARTVFGDGEGVLVGALYPGGKAVAVPGGYRISGRWGYGSFIGYADWVASGCLTEDGAPVLFLCPRSEVEVIDVWDVTGLRATASNDYRTQDLFVPGRLTIPLVDFQPPPRREGPLYAVPMTSVFFASIATVAMGIARAAIDTLVEMAATKRSAGAQTALRENTLVQIDLAHGEALLGSARAYLFDRLGSMWRDAVAGHPITERDRAMVRLAACHAARCAIEAVELAYQSAGGAALPYGSRLERCLRDVHVAGQHAMLGRQGTLEPVGRVLLGLSPGTARL
ncbi:MAG: acyl-CoA dehydrogenase family protein [Geminicoccaceae bacterium]